MVDILTGINSTTAALTAERTRLDVISQNIANAHTTHGPDGKPYQRQVVVFESVLQKAMDGGPDTPTLQVARIEKDPRPPEMIYEPGNPDADEHGMVAMPNINIHEEMADMISASRSYQNNVEIMKTAKQMLLTTLRLGQ